MRGYATDCEDTSHEFQMEVGLAVEIKVTMMSAMLLLNLDEVVEQNFSTALNG